MVRLNVFIQVPLSDRKKELIEKATELIELSLRDKGCIDYDLFSSTTNDDRLLINETWASEEDLKKHMESEHFKRIVPQLEELGTLTLEKFDF